MERTKRKLSNEFHVIYDFDLFIGQKQFHVAFKPFERWFKMKFLIKFDGQLIIIAQKEFHNHTSVAPEVINSCEQWNKRTANANAINKQCSMFLKQHWMGAVLNEPDWLLRSMNSMNSGAECGLCARYQIQQKQRLKFKWLLLLHFSMLT